MRIYQSSWTSNSKLIFWGEDSNATITLEQNSNIHPMACTNEQIAADLQLLEFEADNFGQESILLPSSDSRPLSSPRCICEPSVCEQDTELSTYTLDHKHSNHKHIALKSWNVPCAVFEPLPSIAFLTSIPRDMPSGLRCDDSVYFWLESTKLLLELLTRGRFIPSMVHENNTFCSRWFSVISEQKDRERFELLVKSMPAICRSDGTNERLLNPKDILESFFNTTTDAIIRSFLKSYPIKPAAIASNTTHSVIARNFTASSIALSSKWLCACEWLRGLTDRNSCLNGPNEDFGELHSKLRRWSSRLLSGAPTKTLVTTFRLIAPNPLLQDPLLYDDSSYDDDQFAKNARWQIACSMQEKDNPNLTISASNIWNGELKFLTHSEFTAIDVQELLLKDLCKASHVCEPIRRGLLDPFPTIFSLSTEEAYTFLRTTSVLLEQLGFNVKVPDWWQNSNEHIGLHLSVKTPPFSHFNSDKNAIGLHQLLDYSWNIALGDTLITVDEFKQLVTKHAPLVRIGGQWIELNPDKVIKTLAFLEESAKRPQMTALEALKASYGKQPKDSGLKIIGFSTDGWLNQLINTVNEPLPTLPQPNDFKGDLRQYQIEGISWLSFLSRLGIGGCLADDMGLGKTIQLLALLLNERQNAQIAETNNNHNSTPVTIKVLPTLLIVPMSILDNWAQEATRFAPSLKIYLHHGNQRLSAQEFIDRAQEVDIICTTYSVAFRDEDLLTSVSWGRIALDEAQNIKNLATKQTKAIRRLIQHQLTSQRKVPCHRVALTGTPLENHLDELWSIMDFLNPGYLGSLSHFRTTFATPIERYRNAEASAFLAKAIAPFILRRLKTDPRVISDLPEKIEMEVITSLTQEQAILYQKALDQLLPQVDSAQGLHRKGLVLATITKLKQICDHPSLVLKNKEQIDTIENYTIENNEFITEDFIINETTERSGKLDRLCELLEEFLAADDKTLIFTQFAQMGSILKKHIQDKFGIEVLFLHGSLTKQARSKIIDRFQSKGGPSVFVLSLKAGGLGLNLTQANQVVHYDQWWNPAVENQATDRAYRIGQLRNVQVRKFLCKGTLEEKIAEMVRKKQDLADQIVGSTKNTITQLSTDDLKSLLQLTLY